MVKHTQTGRRQKPTNCLSVFDHFVELAIKGLKSFLHNSTRIQQNEKKKHLKQNQKDFCID